MQGETEDDMKFSASRASKRAPTWHSCTISPKIPLWPASGLPNPDPIQRLARKGFWGNRTAMSCWGSFRSSWCADFHNALSFSLHFFTSLDFPLERCVGVCLMFCYWTQLDANVSGHIRDLWVEEYKSKVCSQLRTQLYDLDNQIIVLKSLQQTWNLMRSSFAAGAALCFRHQGSSLPVMNIAKSSPDLSSAALPTPPATKSDTCWPNNKSQSHKTKGQ